MSSNTESSTPRSIGRSCQRIASQALLNRFMASWLSITSGSSLTFPLVMTNGTCLRRVVLNSRWWIGVEGSITPNLWFCEATLRAYRTGS